MFVFSAERGQLCCFFYDWRIGIPSFYSTMVLNISLIHWKWRINESISKHVLIRGTE